MLGNGVTTYMVSPTTRGTASWPGVSPVENVQATCRSRTLSALMWSRPLKRVDA